MTEFAYHRSVAPMLWVLVAIACVELIVVHLLVALWSRPIALALSVVSLIGVVSLIRLVRSFRHLPVRIEADRLIMRAGHLRSVEIPLSAISGLRKEWDAAALKDRSLLKLSLIAYPNIVIDLREPIASGGIGSRPVLAVAHRLDDPSAFIAALESARGSEPS